MGATYKTTRKMVEEYKGFLIIRETTIFENRFRRDVSEHFELCNPDTTTDKAWNRATNRLCTYGRTIEDIRKVADEIFSGKKVVYTDAERAKYVSNYNSKHGWGFTKETLLATMRMHKNGTPKMKLLMEDRLTDANFHGFSADLNEGNYERFMERLKEEYN